jgi:hypothetical protein
MKKVILTMIAVSLLAMPAFGKDKKKEPPVPSEPTHIALPVNVMNAIMQNLQQRPYAEVANVLDVYKETAQPIIIEPAPKEE